MPHTRRSPIKTISFPNPTILASNLEKKTIRNSPLSRLSQDWRSFQSKPPIDPINTRPRLRATGGLGIFSEQFQGFSIHELLSRGCRVKPPGHHDGQKGLKQTLKPHHSKVLGRHHVFLMMHQSILYIYIYIYVVKMRKLKICVDMHIHVCASSFAYQVLCARSASKVTNY